jgi:hypothetical protein
LLSKKAKAQGTGGNGRQGQKNLKEKIELCIQGGKRQGGDLFAIDFNAGS